MGADLEQREHLCKICGKGFASGRSLGGHMRSHMRPAGFDAEENEKRGNGDRGQASFRTGYGLRENPKKTCRLSDFIGKDSTSSAKDSVECCEEEFPSWKALFDRTRFHSEMTCDLSSEAGEVEEEREDGSWCAQKLSIENFLDDDDERVPTPTVLKRKRRPNRVDSPIIGASSSIIDYESEQEDVAISLMMLSRGIGGYWVTGISGAGESSDKNSVAGEPIYEEVSAKPKTKGAAMAGKSAKPGSRFRCTTCDRSFHSYHALGGHRASHKRIKTCYGMRKINGDDSKTSGDLDGTTVEHLAGPNQKSGVHECFICGKVFSSGNALGGHRRSHFIFNGGNGRHEMAVLLDLNLPAQADEGDSSFSLSRIR